MWMPLIIFSLSPMKIYVFGIFLQFYGNSRLYFLTIVNWVILRSFILLKFGKKSHFKFLATGFEGLWISPTVLWAFKKPCCPPKFMSDRAALFALFSSSFLCYVTSPESRTFRARQQLSAVYRITLRNNRISKEFNMAAITARSAKKNVSYHDLYLYIFRGRAMTWCQNFDLL